MLNANQEFQANTGTVSQSKLAPKSSWKLNRDQNSNNKTGTNARDYQNSTLIKTSNIRIIT